MFEPSATAAYAVRALVYLARQRGEWVRGAGDVAKSADVPRPYLAKILHTLGRRGLLVTKRGSRGGYRLAKSPEVITLLDVIEAVDGPGVFERCLLGLGKCSPKRRCAVHPFWSKERVRIERECRELTLAELASTDNRSH